MTLGLCSIAENFSDLRRKYKEGDAVVIANPKTDEFQVGVGWWLPCLLGVAWLGGSMLCLLCLRRPCEPALAGPFAGLPRSPPPPPLPHVPWRLGLLSCVGAARKGDTPVACCRCFSQIARTLLLPGMLKTLVNNKFLKMLDGLRVRFRLCWHWCGNTHRIAPTSRNALPLCPLLVPALPVTGRGCY